MRARRVKVPSYRPIGYEQIEGLRVKLKGYDKLAKQFLDRAGELFEASADMDTAVRDYVCEGLAYIVHAGYDCQACAYDLNDYQAFVKKTADWFRSRGCAEWFAQGASTLFDSSKPRLFQLVTLKTRKSGGHRIKTLGRVEVA